jgi:serine/threonine-protein kinase RsbW
MGPTKDRELLRHLVRCAYLEEAAINLFNYPYHNPGSFVVRVRCEDTTFEVDLIDQGLAFNPLSVAPLDPKSILEHPELKGMGIHLIRQISDEVHYNRVADKNILTLIMKR